VRRSADAQIKLGEMTQRLRVRLGAILNCVAMRLSCATSDCCVVSTTARRPWSRSTAERTSLISAVEVAAASPIASRTSCVCGDGFDTLAFAVVTPHRQIGQISGDELEGSRAASLDRTANWEHPRIPWLEL
jgi:hypothetical protein